jgi:hypothetical protein
MKNNGLFSSLFIDELKDIVKLDDSAQGRMATLAQTWCTRDTQDTESLWETFLKQALGYLEFVPPTRPDAPGVYLLYEDWSFTKCISVLYIVEPGSDIDNTSVGRFYPAKLLAHLRERKLNWGILTDGAKTGASLSALVSFTSLSPDRISITLQSVVSIPPSS